MNKKVVKSESLIIKNVPVEISSDTQIEAEMKRKKELQKQKNAPKVNIEKDDKGNIKGVEVVCACGEVIKLALEYDENKNNKA